MRKLLVLAVALTLGLTAFSQSLPTPGTSPSQQANGPADLAGLLYAANFGHWQVPQGNNGGYSWTSPLMCVAVSGGIAFPVFNTNAPVTIVDTGNPSNTETVTPTAVQSGVWGCAVSLPATHAHKTFYLQSGTAGLQEALNWAAGTNAVVIVTPDWSTLGGTTGMITSAVAGANTTILDMRTSTAIPYSGSTPSAGVTGTGKTVLQTSATLIGPASNTLTLTAAAPTVAAGQVGLGATTAVVANCGTTGPTACLVVNIAGTTHYIPYY